MEDPTIDAVHLFHFGAKEIEGIFVFDFDRMKTRQPFQDNKILLTTYLVLIFVVSLSLRGVILTFLTTVESKSRPINVLLWMDQTNGVIGTTLVSVFLLAAANTTAPMSELLGDDFCKWIHFSSGKLIQGTLTFKELR